MQTLPAVSFRAAVVLVIATTVLQSIASAQTNVAQASKQLSTAEFGTSAVLAFDGPKGAVFADLIAHEVLQRGVTLVERAKIIAILRERHLTLDDVVAGRADTSILHELARVDTIVLGSVTPITVYLSGADSSRVSAASFRVVDVQSGRILSSVSFNSNTEVLLKGKTYGTAAAMMVAKLIKK